jgi:nitroreductase
MGKPDAHPFIELIRTRYSTEGFDAKRDLSEEQIRELVDDGTQAPSSFNIQHWRFVAVRKPADRVRLQEAAFGQPQVADAPVTFIVLGDIRGVEKLPEVMERAVGCGALPARKAAAWVRMAGKIYADAEAARDEAVRSACLAAMVMMLAAEARGLVSAPLSGFDPARVKELFEIDERYVPVMLLPVGHPAGHPVDRKENRQPRLAVEEVLAFDRGRVF